MFSFIKNLFKSKVKYEEWEDTSGTRPYIHKDEDGSITFEWIGKHNEWRFAINIENDPKESSWYLISKDDVKKGRLYTASGNLSQKFQDLIKKEAL